ncbi:C4b-binding protein alpha chain-like [Palaemon carinicauda]|uniref:C4b-binding protein alpha chain-like n=1 Tax=Palaemon carinicauda TaxID=392227 RepID=UPI0035B62EDF
MPGSNMNLTEINDKEIGAIVTYYCDDGFYIPATFPNASNETTVTCNETLDWEPITLLVTDLFCAQVCFDDPISPVSPANTTWDQVTRVAGTEVNITCPEGYAFPDLNDTVVLTCGENGNWTEVIPEDVVCRRYTLEDPVAPNGTVYNASSPPHWENTTVNFTCQENLLSRDLLNATSMTFNGTDWVPLDPEFVCLMACGDPIPAVDPVTMNFTELGLEGDIAIYECLGGFEGNDALNVTSVCKDGNWTLQEIPVCKMCGSADMPAIPHQGIRVEKGIRSYGAVVTYKCMSGFFDNAETEVSVTCLDGTWSRTEVPFCLPVIASMAELVWAASSDFVEVCGAGSTLHPTSQNDGHFAIRVDTSGLYM